MHSLVAKQSLVAHSSNEYNTLILHGKILEKNTVIACGTCTNKFLVIALQIVSLGKELFLAKSTEAEYVVCVPIEMVRLTK